MKDFTLILGDHFLHFCLLLLECREEVRLDIVQVSGQWVNERDLCGHPGISNIKNGRSGPETDAA